MFDVVASGESNVDINSLIVRHTQAVSATVTVYTASRTFVGVESSSVAWTEAASVSIPDDPTCKLILGISFRYYLLNYVCLLYFLTSSLGGHTS